MLHAFIMIGAFAFVAILSSTSIQAQSALRVADSCRADCADNVGVCLKYLEACHQPGVGCETQRAACRDTQICLRLCR
jgi:hypothetical protein